MAAKKKPSTNKALTVLLESSVIFGLATGVIVAKTGLLDMLLAVSMIAVFLMTLIGTMLFGLVAYITSTTLGGKGRYIEGLTATAYAMLPISAGMLAISLLSWLPLTIGVQIIVLAIVFALGISSLHRGIKEFYRMDMVTAFISVSISVLVILLAVYFSAGLSILNRVAAGML